MQPVYFVSQTNLVIYLCIIAFICVVVYQIGVATGRRREQRKQTNSPQTHV